MPYWPWPPVCFTWRPIAFTALLKVSLYGRRSGIWLTSTPDLRFRRSRLISTWFSPMPHRIVWWVSALRSTRSVRSSASARARPLESFSSSPRDFGAIAIGSSGSGGGGERLGQDLEQLRETDALGRRAGEHGEQPPGGGRLLEVGDQVGRGDL